MALWVEDVILALRNLGGVAAYADLYREIERVRPSEQLTPTWEATVRRTIQQHSSDSEAFEGAEDLFYSVDGIGEGRWGLRSLAPSSPVAPDAREPEAPPRIKVQTYRILRDTELARGLKTLHAHVCQVCGQTIDLPDGRRYSEAHHIQPLGASHGGPDVPENILVLCPNHHAMCDYGALRLDLATLRQLPGHTIGAQFLSYHNERVFRSAPALS
jgi:predicted HNH restriction endonuclease